MRKPTKSKPKKANNPDNGTLTMFLLPFVLIITALIVMSLVSVVIDLEKSLNFPVITVIFSLCTFISAYLVSYRERENGLITGIIHNLPAILIIELISLIINGFSADFNILLSFITMLISSALGGVTGVNRKQKMKRGKR